MPLVLQFVFKDMISNTTEPHYIVTDKLSNELFFKEQILTTTLNFETENQMHYG